MTRETVSLKLSYRQYLNNGTVTHVEHKCIHLAILSTMLISIHLIPIY